MSSSVLSESLSLSSLARSKLHLSVGGKGDCSLHRWVLLKNSITQSPHSNSGTIAQEPRDVNSVYSNSEGAVEDNDVDIGADEEADSFMFPDADKLVDHSPKSGVATSEAEWLDSLLESLGDDEDEDEYTRMDVHVSVLPVDDDEDHLLSPLISPMSSSEDLIDQPAYYPPSVSIPYPIPYPPFHPPLIRSFNIHSSFDSPGSLQYSDALPYHDIDDVEDLSVPDAIEDDSDDESDAPTTPSISHTSATFPFGLSLPERTAGLQSQPHVYIDSPSSYFYPFEIDPLPFSDDHHFYNYNTVYQEC